MRLALLCAALQLSAQVPDDLPQLAAAAAAAMRSGDYAAAERYNAAIVKLSPQTAEAHINLGLSRFALKKYGDAAEAFEVGLRIRPDLHNGRLFLGISEFNLNRIEKAAATLEKFRAARPDDFQGHYYLGLCMIALERFREAEISLLQARRVEPRNAEALYHLASAYLGLARQENANRDVLRTRYEAAVREIETVDPRSYRIPQLRAAYYQANGEPIKAREELERLLAGSPKIRGLHYTLGCIYVESREYENARQQFEAELRLDAPYPRTHLQLAHTFIELGQPDRAVPLLEIAKQAEPSSGVVWVEVGRAQKALDRHDLAAAAFQRAIDAGERKSSVYYQLAMELRRSGKAAESAAALRQSQQLRSQENVLPGSTAEQADPIEQGKAALNAGRFADAEALFQRAWKESSRCDALFYAGLAGQRAGKATGAIVAFRSAAECNPSLLGAHLALAEAYSERRDDSRALAAYETVLKVAPRHAGALRAAAGLYLRHQMNEKAAIALEILVELEPGDVQARADLGAAYAATSQFDRAETQFRTALRIDPGVPSALTGLANLRLREDDSSEAIQLATKAIELAPNAYEPRYVLGSACMLAGRYEKAAGAFEAAVKVGGSDPEIYYRMATVYAKLGRQAEANTARAEFAARKAESTRLGETHREVAELVRQAQTRVEQGDLKSAAALMEKVVAADASNPQSLFRLAGLYYDLGRYDEARKQIQAAIERAPAEWSYHYLQALVEKSSGCLDEARSSLEVALKLNRQAPEVQKLLAELNASPR